MCNKPGSLNTFEKLADGTQCTITKPVAAKGFCKDGKCLAS